MPRSSRLSIAKMLAFAVVVLAIVRPVCGQDRTGPFTHAPRSVRARSHDQRHIRIEMDLDLDKKEAVCRVVHFLAPLKTTSIVELDAVGMRVSRVQRLTLAVDTELPDLGDALGAPLPGGVDAPFRHEGERLSIELGSEVPIDTPLAIAIDYTLSQPKSGLHFVLPDADEPFSLRMCWTQSEPEFARWWYPCFDHPSDRVTSETVVRAPADLFVLSNGSLTAKSEPDNGKRIWRWRQTQSHVPYLVSVVAGDFEAYEQSWDGIPVVSYVPRGRLEDAPRSFERTPAMVDYFSKSIGVRYPWPKYTQICVDEYNWGGMEHTSCTTLNLDTLHDARAHLDVSSENLVAHELAHQWFGDLVTCSDWADLWLNESFATYFATLWTEHADGWDEAWDERRREAENYLGEDAVYRRPISTNRYDRPDAMFDRHTYPKGARVLHMLRFELGEERFWRGVRRYTTLHQHRTVETADFRRAMEEATGEGLGWFFDQWIHHGGHPEFKVEWDWNADAKMVAVRVKQTQPRDAVTPLFRTSCEIEIVGDSEPSVHRVMISQAEETFHFPAPVRPRRVVFDPKDWILKKLDQAKSIEEAIHQTTSKHVSARWSAVRELAGHVDHAESQATLRRLAVEDTSEAVRQEAVRALASAGGDPIRETLVAVATKDTKASVRRQAIEGLGKFAHDDSRRTLRQAIAQDPSYACVAEALRSLTKIDREKATPELLGVLQTPSQRDQIFRAAVDSLVDLGDKSWHDRLPGMLEAAQSQERRASVTAAIARTKPNDPAALAALKPLLASRRNGVRRAVVNALADLGRTEAIAWLQEQREKETSVGMARVFDEALDRLRAQSKGVETALENERLRETTRRLEERVHKLEEGK